MNGYTSIEIAGNKVGLKFAFPAIKWFTEEVIKDTEGVFYLDSGMTDYGWAKMMQCAYRNNCLLNETHPELKFRDFVEWIESAMETEEGKAQMVEVMKVYADSSINKKVVASEDEKKSQDSTEPTTASTSTDSNPLPTENSAGSRGIYIEQPSETSY